MKNIKFETIEQAKNFVAEKSASVGAAMDKLKAIDKVMKNAIIHGIFDCLDEDSPYYVKTNFSRQFAKEMAELGTKDFVGKMMAAQRHQWAKRRSLQNFVSKKLLCPSVVPTSLDRGQAVMKLSRLEYYDRTEFDVNKIGMELLLEQKPTLINWFVSTVNKNPLFTLSACRRDEKDEYFELFDITIEDARKILDNDYLVPRISAKTIYFVPNFGHETVDIRSWSYGKATDDWDHYSTCLEISFSSVQAEWTSEPHIYGESVYLWFGSPPTVN